MSTIFSFSQGPSPKVINLVNLPKILLPRVLIHGGKSFRLSKLFPTVQSWPVSQIRVKFDNETRFDWQVKADQTHRKNVFKHCQWHTGHMSNALIVLLIMAAQSEGRSRSHTRNRSHTTRSCLVMVVLVVVMVVVTFLATKPENSVTSTSLKGETITASLDAMCGYSLSLAIFCLPSSVKLNLLTPFGHYYNGFHHHRHHHHRPVVHSPFFWL